ncbi:unnamed protein product, partial [Sphenostylis stenocarpa]
ACPSSSRRSSGLYLEAGQDLGSTAAPPLPVQSTAGLLCRGDRLEGKGVDPLARFPFGCTVLWRMILWGDGRTISDVADPFGEHVVEPPDTTSDVADPSVDGYKPLIRLVRSVVWDRMGMNPPSGWYGPLCGTGWV